MEYTFDKRGVKIIRRVTEKPDDKFSTDVKTKFKLTLCANDCSERISSLYFGTTTKISQTVISTCSKRPSSNACSSRSTALMDVRSPCRCLQMAPRCIISRAI
ncbi:hypothetical protein EG68_01689 [Paragonimus skrjabini miyazakii]|uniref:Uncharacterized protein n=1 Tax=Paragonimus skrjabini miyazakii TaxID=59628 RepID=A0A8S9Z1A4_9TREM|nr:hypothetical protein EG68_01689 [Paragonimus skrjabini miyazakii]